MKKTETRSDRPARFMNQYLFQPFLELMNQIGQYGHEKYGPLSFHARALQGDFSRGDHPRTEAAEILRHAKEHAEMYLRGELHDHFATREHQLAAVAFNAMMEFYFSRQNAHTREASAEAELPAA